MACTTVNIAYYLSDALGELEVMLDRRTLQDDWRGLGESITDNAPVYSHMRLLCERRKTAKTQTQQDKVRYIIMLQTKPCRFDYWPTDHIHSCAM